MNFSREKSVIAIPAIISLIGLLLILNSTTIGAFMANNYLAKLGSMDTQQFLIVFEGYIASYRLVGAIFLGIGSFFSIKYILSMYDKD